jgi:hypothetical protein
MSVEVTSDSKLKCEIDLKVVSLKIAELGFRSDIACELRI